MVTRIQNVASFCRGVFYASVAAYIVLYSFEGSDDGGPTSALRHRLLQHISRNASFLTASLQGRLGNQMFVYASLYGIARRTGLEPVVAADSELGHVFRHLAAMSMPRTLLEGFDVVVRDDACCIYRSQLLRLPAGHVKIASYLQAHRYFADYASEIRDQFRFDEATTARATAALLSALHSIGETPGSGNPRVGVHIRRGDYVKVSKVTGQKMPPVSYIRKAMYHFRHRFPSAAFVIVTDDHVWALENVGGSDVAVISSPEPEVDMCVLALCDHVIITTGTFGWWAAWLAGGDVVYYADVATEGSLYARQFSSDDYFPPSWIGMT
ncbi:PREDICTED: galactoside 2-alpha-L-fucosyltransferase 3-like isoform X1 [Priapulus caudatus]|uniref:L-Fucosyltransferase n=1 Tax=Priapulus caudatus TaxID=37621 RepID=A0ABM1EWA7_PRICU|nr:PREDICTED: galactoside 2-alpha-L-fucosyltransferase 3-like isoform X1 [Priapulus caudatus]